MGSFFFWCFMSDLVLVNRVYSCVVVFPIYWSLHLLQVIRYMTQDDLQLMAEVMGNDSPVVELLNLLDSLM